MYSRISVRNLRAVRSMDLRDLGRVVLISGRNDTGKTTLLEAVFILAGGGQPQQVLVIDNLRGAATTRFDSYVDADTPWSKVFRDFDAGHDIRVSGTFRGRETSIQIRSIRAETLRALTVSRESDGKSQATTPLPLHALQMEVREPGQTRTHLMTIQEKEVRIEPPPHSVNFRGLFHTASWSPSLQDVERYSDLVVAGDDKWIVPVLQLVDPRIQALSVATSTGLPIVWADVGLRRLAPLYLLGMGINRLFVFLTSIAYCAGGVVMIDEFENGIHHSALEPVWRSVAEALRRFDTQMFATTHSRECVAAAYESLDSDGRSDLSFFRLDRDVQGGVEAKRYSQAALRGALATGLEVR